MGGAKREWEARMERGWSASDERVCAACVADYALKEAVRAQETTDDGPCSSCGRELSAPFDALLEAFVDGISFLYDDALNSVPFVSSEGGFVGATTWDTWDLLEEFYDCFEDEVSDKIIEELRARMDPKDWVDRDDPDYGPRALLDEAWLQFCLAIKHDTRFVFWLESIPKDSVEQASWQIAPAAALRHVGNMLDELGLFKEYEKDQLFFRARTFPRDREVPSSAKSLGTPSQHISLQGNRMSPAGIPMFYAGESEAVALDEVSVRTANRAASVGKFASTQRFSVVDLTDIPPVPSPFDQERRHQGWMISFLESFVEKISEPIQMGRDQVDYVPTQVMTEYLLRIHWGRDKIHGIRYPSAAHEGGVCVVLVVSDTDCLESEAQGEPDRLQMRFLSRALYQADLRWNAIEDGLSPA
ncbi:RES domain-containing protein [Arthrobacter sp. UYEF6]